MTTTLQFKNQSISKGDLAEQLFGSDPGITYDCALPQFWIDKMSLFFPDAYIEQIGGFSGHFVYVYDHGRAMAYIHPLTAEGCRILGQLSLHN